MNGLFDITEFGAKADSNTLNTEAFDKAITACHEAGGGVVNCGPGTYLTGSINLKSNVELHLRPGCVIKGSADIADYESFASEGFINDRSPEGIDKYLIGASHAENIAVTGPGLIDGNGLVFYEGMAVVGGKFEAKPDKRHRILMFHKCTDVRLEDAAFLDSPCWTIWLMQCERVQVHQIRITGDRRMRNNDGLDIDGCKDVAVSGCLIDTDDDCLVTRAIQEVYDSPAICENVVITNCVLKSACNGIRIGCPTDNIVRNCTFSNITITETNNGIVFDFPARYARAESSTTADIRDIAFSDMLMECWGRPIRMDIEDELEITRLAGISFANMRMRGGMPCLIKGSELTTIEDVTISNSRIEIAGENVLNTHNCSGVKLNQVELVNRGA